MQPLPGRFWLVAAAVAAPGLAVLTIGAAAGWAPIVAAAVGAVLVAVAACVIAWAAVRDMAALADRVELIGAEDGVAPAQSLLTPLASDLALGIARARRRTSSIQRAQEARAAASEAVIDSVPEPLMVLDPSRVITHANNAAETLLGGRLAGRPLAEVIRHPAVLDSVAETFRDGNNRSVEFELTAPVRRYMRARVANLASTLATGEALVLTLEDETAMRRAQQMRVDFVANVSHELKTPLATLLGFIETLQGPARDDAEARDRFLSIMQTESARMRRIVDDLLSLSRIEAEEHNAPTEAVDLRDVLEMTCDVLHFVAAERGSTIDLRLPRDLPSVVGDEDQLAQVFRNLIENAVKYGRAGTAVEVDVRVDVVGGQKQVAVGVRDHGEGIPRNHLQRLTERFYRVDAARSREIGGTGLGLAIVKHIVNRHRGRLTIESDPGKGSVFTVHLPVAGNGAVIKP
ncbi:two-component system phosphate regulon sensor histidine kinase PhoR [Constrictibacter sp. MBR-5]|jgi:two-component system phosphate regulon sensor histidine kinase PhoR|uniref:ATP-binding protein n=1 Tax=Constrictibacter sp. MBR-5 TaxID=3156467 RepID=UPI0033917C2C